MNNREFTRVRSRIPVDIEIGGTTVSGEVRDISLDGLWLPTADRFDEGAACHVTIHLAEAVKVRADGVVIRSAPEGFAVHFTELLGLDSYEHLRNLILYNAVEPSTVEQEFHSHLGLLRADASLQPPD